MPRKPLFTLVCYCHAIFLDLFPPEFCMLSMHGTGLFFHTSNLHWHLPRVPKMPVMYGSCRLFTGSLGKVWLQC